MSKKLKKIPYGISDFEIIRKENYYYIDKTGFIKSLEDSSRYIFFIRPRRFGKSLWLSLMENYYDISKKDLFEKLFKGTYIYDNPTEERNRYLVLSFNFSTVRSHMEEVENSFDNTIKIASLKFMRKYSNYIKDIDKKYEKIENAKRASETLKYLISFIEGEEKIYLLIDEYDNFTNTIISSTGQEQYMSITHGEGFYRHFFNVVKSGTSGSGVPISKLFITGVSPVTMDDVTSGFNIGDNITTDITFNEMAGFTETEVKDILKYYKIKDEKDKIIELMKKWYNNYLFSEDGETRIYNSDMTLYFVKEYLKTGKLPKDMADYNIRTDYNKLKYLIVTDMKGHLRVNGNFEKLKVILEEGLIRANLVNTFPVEKIIDPENFISLLYYFGLLTIKSVTRGMTDLIIPNEVIRQLYYEYIRDGYRDTKIFNLDLYKLGNLFSDMAYEGKWEGLFTYLADEMNIQTSIRDYIEGERAIQTFFRVYLNVSNYYITRTEYELNKGYCDILMLPDLFRYPDIKYSYLIELKYIKPSEYTRATEMKKIQDGREKLDRYQNDGSLKKMMGKTGIIRLLMVFSGTELKYKEVR